MRPHKKTWICKSQLGSSWCGVIARETSDLLVLNEGHCTSTAAIFCLYNPLRLCTARSSWRMSRRAKKTHSRDIKSKSLNQIKTKTCKVTVKKRSRSVDSC